MPLNITSCTVKIFAGWLHRVLQEGTPRKGDVSGKTIAASAVKRGGERKLRGRTGEAAHAADRVWPRPLNVSQWGKVRGRADQQRGRIAASMAVLPYAPESFQLFPHALALPVLWPARGPIDLTY